MYYTVIKHFGQLRTLEKCNKHSPAARVFHISLVSSNARRVLSQCNTRLRLLYLLYKEHSAGFVVYNVHVHLCREQILFKAHRNTSNLLSGFFWLRKIQQLSLGFAFPSDWE